VFVICAVSLVMVVLAYRVLRKINIKDFQEWVLGGNIMLIVNKYRFLEINYYE